ncbi:hypothetical protein C7S15_7995 [Burkholderia cepacia]|nr:hypothetical protein [Burkholderia cepacia]
MLVESDRIFRTRYDISPAKSMRKLRIYLASPRQGLVITLPDLWKPQCWHRSIIVISFRMCTDSSWDHWCHFRHRLVW